MSEGREHLHYTAWRWATVAALLLAALSFLHTSLTVARVHENQSALREDLAARFLHFDNKVSKIESLLRVQPEDVLEKTDAVLDEIRALRQEKPR